MKTLRWKKQGHYNIAVGAVSRFTIWKSPIGRFLLWKIPKEYGSESTFFLGTKIGEYDTLKEAKAYAQEYFEKRVSRCYESGKGGR